MWTNPKKNEILKRDNVWYRRCKRKLARFYRWVFRLPEPPLRFFVTESVGISIGNMVAVSKATFTISDDAQREDNAKTESAANAPNRCGRCAKKGIDY